MALPGWLKSSGSISRTLKTSFCFISRTMAHEASKNGDIEFESFQERLGRIKSKTAIKTEYRPPNFVSALVPTLHSDSFDVKGIKIHPWVILKVFDHLDLCWPQYREYRDSSDGIYILKLQVDNAPELYHTNSLLHPLLLEGKMLFLKRSSRVFQNIMRHPDKETPYAVMTNLDVNVNLETRRPTPFPDSWRHPSIPSEGSILGFDIPAKPPTTIKSQRRVYQSDNDENGHMNYTSYIRFCHDMFVDNLSQGKYKQNAAEHLEAGLKQMQIIFKSECLRGDILDMESWEDSHEEGTYYFEMSKGTDIVVSVIFRFFNKINMASDVKGKL